MTGRFARLCLPLVLLTPFASGGGATIERLPTDVVPTFQSLRLKVDATQSTYGGETTVRLQVKRTAARIVLHAQELTIDTVSLSGTDGPIAVRYSALGTELLQVTPASRLRPGDYTLTIRFRNEFNTDANALYRLSFAGESYTFTQFEDVQARRSFPCWDEPSFKFPYQMTLTVPKAHRAFANTLVESESTEGEEKTVVFKPTPPLPSYLLALATGPFETVPIAGMSVPGQLIVPKGMSRLTADAVSSVPPLLAALERYFGQNYPFDKLDLIAVPEYWYGAMENPGLITFRDSLLLLDPEQGTWSARQRLRVVLAHELAHMWFGDLVTMEWWDDLWLNESFASWMGTKVMEQVYPETFTAAAQIAAVQGAYSIDARDTTRAIRQPVKTQAVLTQAADALAYEKGEAVLGMIETWIGEAAFRRGVLAYLKDHAWKNARGADLWSALSKASGKDVSAVLTSFLDQPGVPSVSVQLRPAGRVVLRQQRYHRSTSVSPKRQLWKIPVSLRAATSNGVNTVTVLLDKSETTVDVAPGQELLWIHPNGGERGYYRWELEPQLLERLIDTRAQLDLRERVGLLGNLEALLDAGAIGADRYLALVSQFTSEADPLVVSALFGAVAHAESLVEPAQRDAFRRFVRATTAPALDRIGIDPRPGENPRIAALRPDAIATLGDLGRDDATLSLAQSRAMALLADPSAAPSELVEVYFSLAALRGDVALFDALRTRFESATLPRDRSTYLSALGSFRRPEVVARALDYALTGPLRPNEISVIPRSVAQDDETAALVWDWIKRNYDKYKQRVPTFALASLPFYAGGCEPARLADAKSFFAEPDHNVPGTVRTLGQVDEAVNVCVKMRKQHAPALNRYFQSETASH